MPPRPGGNMENVDMATNRRRRRIFRRLNEQMNPQNIEFQRRVAAVEARHEELSQMFSVIDPSGFDLQMVLTTLSHDPVEDGLSQAFEPSASSSSIFLHVSVPGESHTRCSIDSSMPSEANSLVPYEAPYSDFLEDTFFKTRPNGKQAAKNKKKNKKNKRGHRRMEQEQASQIRENNERDVLIKDSASTVDEASLERPGCEISWSTPAANEMELTRQTSSYFYLREKSSSSNNFKWLNSSTNSPNSSWSINADIKDLYIGKYERTPSKSTDSGCLRSGHGKSWINSSNCGKRVCVINGVGAQEMQLCSDASEDDDFQLVVSRKRAQEMKRMARPRHGATSRDSIKDNETHKPRKFQTSVPNAITLQDYVTRLDPDCFSSGPRENHRVKLYKNPNLSREATINGFAEDNSAGSTEQNLSGIETVHPKKSDNNQMAPSLASHVVVEMDMDDTCPTQEPELKVLPTGDGDTFHEDSRPDEAHLDDVCPPLPKPTVEEKSNTIKQIAVSCSVSSLTEIVKAANDAYKTQVTSEKHLSSGHPIADIETFMYAAAPVIGHISSTRCRPCLQDGSVSKSPCQYQISNVFLRSVWQWYEEPGSFGLNVEFNNGLSSQCSAIFMPSLSAIQLFGQSNESLDCMFEDQEEACLPDRDGKGLLFEYFESEHPSLRPPLLNKIKQLIGDANLSGSQVAGDPKTLENVKLSDVHPASWFCVAWYPIYRIPQGNFHAAFLTYHSLGKLVPQTCIPDMADGITRVVSPVVGLLSYNGMGEQWFELRDAGTKPASSDDSNTTDRAGFVKDSLRTLRRSAAVIARAVVPKATGETMNHHPDYEFFLSRSN